MTKKERQVYNRFLDYSFYFEYSSVNEKVR